MEIFGITASSEKKEAAKAFLSYFLSSENMDQYDWTLSVNKTSFRKTLPISETKEQMTVMYPEQDSRRDSHSEIKCRGSGGICKFLK